MVAFEGMWASAFVDGTGPLGNGIDIESTLQAWAAVTGVWPQGARGAAPVDSIVADEVILVAVVIIIVVILCVVSIAITVSGAPAAVLDVAMGITITTTPTTMLSLSSLPP